MNNKDKIADLERENERLRLWMREWKQVAMKNSARLGAAHRGYSAAMMEEERLKRKAERECERLREMVADRDNVIAKLTEQIDRDALARHGADDEKMERIDELSAKLERYEGAVEVGFAYDTVGAYFVLNTDGMTHDEHRAIPGDGSEFRVLIIADQGRKCECGLRTRLVGDGCEVCNPDLAADLADKGRAK